MILQLEELGNIVNLNFVIDYFGIFYLGLCKSRLVKKLCKT